MKAEKLPLIMIVTAAILVTPSVLTSPVLAQVPPAGTAGGTTDMEEDNQGTTDGGTAAADESPSELYQTFQSCLSEAEGTETFATEDEIRGCFVEAGYTGAGDDNQDDEDENENDDDQNENEGDETN